MMIIPVINIFLSLIMRWREIFNTCDKRKRNKKGIKLIEANLL